MTRGFLVALMALAATTALAADPGPKAETPPATSARTLDTITIEGAVDVPQVLFITSRENARFDDGLGWFFLPSADEILAEVPLPDAVRAGPFAPTAMTNDITVPADPAPPEAKE